MGANSGVSSGQTSGSASGGTSSGAGTGSSIGSGAATGTGTGTGTTVGGSGGVGSGNTGGGTGTSVGGSGTATSGEISSGSSGTIAAATGSGGSSGVGSAGSSTAGAGSGSSASADGGPVTLPDGSVHDIPTGYTGTPFQGVMAQIPGTVYARNYDTGGEGVGFHHPGATNCGDWPGGMAMYRTGADCVGLSVENAQKPDVTVTGAPANYGEIYISYCAMGEWLKYTVEVTESGTYAITGSVGAPACAVSFSFSVTPPVTTGTVMVPASVDQAQPGHEMYHVWATDNLGMVTLQAGVYVMTFTIVTSQGNFDSFIFTKM